MKKITQKWNILSLLFVLFKKKVKKKQFLKAKNSPLFMTKLKSEQNLKQTKMSPVVKINCYFKELSKFNAIL